MKKPLLALLSLSLVSFNVFAQVDDYGKYEKAVLESQAAAKKSLKTRDAKNISTAHYKLAVAQNSARQAGHTCDIGYISEIVSNLQVAADNSAWFQKSLPNLAVYKNNSAESLTLQLIAAGLVKGKPMSRAAFAAALQNIVATSDVTLYKPQPGVMPLGEIRFVNGQAIETSNIFDVIDEEEAGIRTEVSGPVPAEIKLVNGKITINMNGQPRYRVEVLRNDKPAQKDVRSTDEIQFKSIGAEDDYMGQLFVYADECSA